MRVDWCVSSWFRIKNTVACAGRCTGRVLEDDRSTDPCDGPAPPRRNAPPPFQPRERAQGPSAMGLQQALLQPGRASSPRSVSRGGFPDGWH